MATLVELTDLKKVYDASAQGAALDGVDLSLVTGEFVAIMGPSGSGKSTLLNLIAGIDRPTEGHVVVDGVDLGRLNETGLARYRRDRVGFIFQFFNLLNNLTVLDNVMLPALLAGVKRPEAMSRARALLERLGIGETAEQFPARLSGGQQQRVAICRALVNRPLLLLADEPTGALDSANGEEVMKLLHELNAEGQTMAMVTHDPGLAHRWSKRCVQLLDGHVVGDTAIAENAMSREPVAHPTSA